MIAEIVKVVIAAIVYAICMEFARKITGVEIKAKSSVGRIIYFAIDVVAVCLVIDFILSLWLQ